LNLNNVLKYLQFSFDIFVYDFLSQIVLSEDKEIDDKNAELL